MARPSKLTEDQWQTISLRALDGESISALGREFKITEGAIRKRISTKHEKLKTVAAQIVEAEQAVSALSLSEQVITKRLAEDLRAISASLATAGKHGAAISSRVMQIALTQAGKINEDDPMETADVLQSVAALSRIANESSSIGMNVAKIAKDQPKDKTEGSGLVDRLTKEHRDAIFAAARTNY